MIHIMITFLKSFQNGHILIFVFQPFLAKDYQNGSNQDPDIKFYNDIFSIETSYLLPYEANNKMKRFSSEIFSILYLNTKKL